MVYLEGVVYLKKEIKILRGNILTNKTKNHFQPLGVFEKLCVLTDLGGFFNSESDFCNFIEKSPIFLMNIRKHPEYAEIAAKFLKTVTEQNEEKKAETVNDLLDREIFKSIEVLVDIRDNAPKDASRIKAIQELLSRAENAPRSKDRDAENTSKVILQIPFAQVETIKKVSEEVGETDLLEMLEGEDYTTVSGDGNV